MNQFYNHLILSGTKIVPAGPVNRYPFYNHLILSGTKIAFCVPVSLVEFYNHLILSGTKIEENPYGWKLSFTIT